jgi:uncharacterized protein (DUF1778 family)
MTSDQESLIRTAAEFEHATVTDFMVTASVDRARDTLADRRVFLLDDEQWAQFSALLDRAPRPLPRLAAALAQPSVFSPE